MEDAELKNDDFKEINDEKLDQVAGGALFSDFSDEEYEAAGVEVIGSGVFYNDGYRLKSNGEDLDSFLSFWAVKMFKATGKQASCIHEIRTFAFTGKTW